MFSVIRASTLLHQICLNKRLGLCHMLSFDIPSSTSNGIYFPRNSIRREFTSLQKSSNQREFKVKCKFYPIPKESIRYLSWDSISNYISGISKKGEEMISSTTTSDVAGSSESSSILDSLLDTNLPVNTGTNKVVLTDVAHYIGDFLHTQLGLSAWTSLVLLTIVSCGSSTLLYVGLVKLLRSSILSEKQAHFVDGIITHPNVKIDGIKGGPILSIFREMHVLYCFQMGLLLTGTLNGFGLASHLVDPFESIIMSPLKTGAFSILAAGFVSWTFILRWDKKSFLMTHETDPQIISKIKEAYGSVYLLNYRPYEKPTRHDFYPTGSQVSIFSAYNITKLIGSSMSFLTASSNPVSFSVCLITLNLYAYGQDYIVRQLFFNEFLKTYKVEMKPNQEKKLPKTVDVAKAYEASYIRSLQKFQRSGNVKKVKAPVKSGEEEDSILPHERHMEK